MVNKGALHEQINAVAVPVLSQDRSVLLSLSAGGISQLFDDAKLRQVGLELTQFAARPAPALAHRIEAGVPRPHPYQLFTVTSWP